MGGKREPNDDGDSEQAYGGVAVTGADAWEARKSQTTMMTVSGRMVEWQ